MVATAELSRGSVPSLILIGQKHSGTCTVRLNVFAVSSINRSETGWQLQT